MTKVKGLLCVFMLAILLFPASAFPQAVPPKVDIKEKVSGILTKVKTFLVNDGDVASYCNETKKTFDLTTFVGGIATELGMRLHVLDNATVHDGIAGFEDDFMSINADGLPKDSGKSASDFADATAFSNHNDNATRHLTEAERLVMGGHIADSAIHVDNSSAISTHMGDSEIHGPYDSTQIADTGSVPGGPTVWDSLNTAGGAIDGLYTGLGDHVDNATPHTRIDDEATSESTTWSSTKIDAEIGEGGGGMYVHGLDNASVHEWQGAFTLDNFLSFDASGLPKDSGKNANSFLDNSTIIATGKVLYVDVSRAEDYMPTGSIVLPYHTVREANDFIGTLSPPASYGWTVVVLPGIYKEKVHCKTYTNYIGQPIEKGILSETTLFGNIRFDGSSIDGVTIAGFCAGMAIGGLTESFFSGSNCNNVIISDCAVQMSNSATTPTIKFSGGSYNVGLVMNCTLVIASNASTIPSVIELDGNGVGGLSVFDTQLDIPNVANAMGINAKNTSASVFVRGCTFTYGDPAINLDGAFRPAVYFNSFIAPRGTGIRMANDPSNAPARIFGNQFYGANELSDANKGGIVVDADSKVDIISNKFYATRVNGVIITNDETDVDDIFIRDNTFYYFWGNSDWYYIKDEHSGTGDIDATGNIYEFLPSVTGTTPDGHPRISTNVAWVPYQTLDLSSSAIYDDSDIANDHGGFSIANALDYIKDHIDNATIHFDNATIVSHIDNGTIHGGQASWVVYDNETGDAVPDNATFILVDTYSPASPVHVALPAITANTKPKPVTVKLGAGDYNVRISIAAGQVLDMVQDGEFTLSGQDSVTFAPFWNPDGDPDPIGMWWVVGNLVKQTI